MSSSASRLASSGKKAKNADIQGTRVSGPIFQSWAYTDFPLFDSAGGSEIVDLEEYETQAGGYPQELRLDDSYRDYNPPTKCCGNICEHTIAHTCTFHQTTPPNYTASSVHANQGSPSYVKTPENDPRHENSHSFRAYAATPYSDIYSTTSTLPAEITDTPPLQTWISIPERHESLAYRLQRPHLPASTHKYHRHTSKNDKKRQSSKRA